MHKILLGLLLLPQLTFGQINGNVLDDHINQPVVGAKIYCSNGEKTISDFDGNFSLNVNTFPVTLITIMPPFINDTTVVSASGNISIKLKEEVQNIATVVVSAGRRQQEIEEVPISMEVIRPGLIDNKGITNIEQAVDQTPGVYAMDGQVSIRGGSGFAYGAGSRVLVLWNGMPMLSGYAGDTQWNAIPMEQASQIEIMKGASSVLYGSGALNGVIALTEKEPSLVPETKFKIQTGIYDKPSRASLHWWKKENNSAVRPATGAPMNQNFEFYRGQKFKMWGYTVSTNLFHDDGYREGEVEYRGRVSGTIYLHPSKWKKVKAGVGYNIQSQRTGSFLIWQSDSAGYTPSGGIYSKLPLFGKYTPDPKDSAATMTYNLGKRIFIDPYVKFFDKYNNRHNFKGRMYYTKNAILNTEDQSSMSTISMFEYQFQRQFTENITLTAGATETYNNVKATLFGNHFANNIAAYAQYEHHIGKFDISAGFRVEHYKMDGMEEDTKYKIGKSTIPVYPIFRAGLHYQPAKYTHLRASFGQGIRYPSVAERYTMTSVGALNIFPNSQLNPEIGWAAEIGVKQGVKIGEWKGLIDVSGFINEYRDMIEFTFGVYDPERYNELKIIGNNPSQEDLNRYLELVSKGYGLAQMIGFQAQNTENARITGIDFSFSSTGNIKGVEILSMIGYTYMNPVTLNNDSTYRSSFSDTTSGMLKYRFRHMAKLDVELNYKKYSLGFSFRYNSYMSNIDKVFEEELPGDNYILPGLKEYRQEHNGGTFVFDMRAGYKFNDHFRVGLIANNILNAEYSSRPGDIQPPRNFAVQLQVKL